MDTVVGACVVTSVVFATVIWICPVVYPFSEKGGKTDTQWLEYSPVLAESMSYK